MRISSIHLQNFKRFTDLTIRDIPPTAKLVLVVGPNGSGKSSLFDALLHWHGLTSGINRQQDQLYYQKQGDMPFEWSRSVTVSLHPPSRPAPNCVYVRTAYRNDADFTVNRLQRQADPVNSGEMQQRRLIDDDKTVSTNYQRLIYQTMTGVYDENNNEITVQNLRDSLIGEIRASMRNVFANLTLNNISDPLGQGSFFFEKGTANSYHYKNLSGGEKAAFDLLIDLHMKRSFYHDAIYCIDEIDVHLHTSVQGRLLREMAEVIPGDSQLWVTTHSLGALRAAQSIEAESPGTVCILDFDGVDADSSGTLVPTTLNRVVWDKMLSVTIGDLADHVAPGVIVICEGSSTGNRRKDFDAKVYDRVLGTHEPGIVFISGGSAEEVKKAGDYLRNVLSAILPRAKVVSLIDRDDRTATEIGDEESKHHIVLGKRNLESYLLADDVLWAFVDSIGQPERFNEVVQIRERALRSSQARNNPPDDLKSAAGEFYDELRKTFGLQAMGNTAEAFMRDTLAPLIRPGMRTYDELHSCIIAKIEKVAGR